METFLGHHQANEIVIPVGEICISSTFIVSARKVEIIHCKRSKSSTLCGQCMEAIREIRNASGMIVILAKFLGILMLASWKHAKCPYCTHYNFRSPLRVHSSSFILLLQIDFLTHDFNPRLQRETDGEHYEFAEDWGEKTPYFVLTGFNDWKERLRLENTWTMRLENKIQHLRGELLYDVTWNDLITHVISKFFRACSWKMGPNKRFCRG